MNFRLPVVLGILVFGSLPDFAANIVLTGHDDDYHSKVGPDSIDALSQIKSFTTYAANGSSLPLLTLDAGSELTTSLVAAGVSNFVNVNPAIAANITDALFDPTKYSAFVVASDSSCGGCDNNALASTNINSHASAIETFVNAGGGVVAFAGASNTAYYKFLPTTAASVGGAPSTGYSQTPVGASLGIVAVNNDETHNLFYAPGTNGTSSAYQVAEVNSFGNGTIKGPDAATTLVCTGCSTSNGELVGGGTPEPSTITLMISGLGGVFLYVRRKRKSASVA